jgi:hypothetical protein
LSRHRCPEADEAFEEELKKAGGREMIGGKFLKHIWFWASVLLILSFGLFGTGYGGVNAAPISAGMELPKFTIPGSDSKEAQTYLGLKDPGAFAVSEVSGKMVLIEFMSTF